MPTTLLLASAVSLALLATALISGRVLAPNALHQKTRDSRPRLYWSQVLGLFVIAAGLLAAGLYKYPALVAH